VQIQWKFCEEAERDHRRNKRQYAHTYHYPGIICLCRAFFDLPADYQEGLLLHEAGHLLAGEAAGEDDANRAAYRAFGKRIEYRDSPYGKDLERVANVDRKMKLRRNPEHSDELPYDQWIPTHAVRFNDDGTTSLMTEKHANPLANMSQGWLYGRYKSGPKKGKLIFHPARDAYDYDPTKLKDDEGKHARGIGLPAAGFARAAGKKRRKS
jgi:hypothetical protein